MQITRLIPNCAPPAFVSRMHAQGRPHQFSLNARTDSWNEPSASSSESLPGWQNPAFLRQVLHAEMFVVIRQDQAALDYVLQLTNVAGQ